MAFAALIHYTVTLTAASQSLKALAGLLDSQDVPLQSISIQADGANAGAAYLGGDGVTTANYLVRIPAAAAGVPSAPLIFESGNRPTKLSEVFVVGSAGEKLHVGGFVW